MISITGGYNQQFVAGAPKIHKLKYASDTLGASDAVTLYAFRTRMTLGEDANNLLDAVVNEVTVQHFNDAYNDSMTLNELVELDLAAA